MDGMGLPVESRRLCDNRVWTVEAFVAYRLHPVNAGRVLTGIRLDCTWDYTPSGHDGATADRYPGVPAGHFPKEFV